MLRKMAVAAASKPHVEIRQSGERFRIKTSTTVRTTEIDFAIGEEFDEETVDGRKCKVTEGPATPPTSAPGDRHLILYLLQSLATWETENKIYCKQTLVNGSGPKTFWSRELKGDELELVSSGSPLWERWEGGLLIPDFRAYLGRLCGESGRRTLTGPLRIHPKSLSRSPNRCPDILQDSVSARKQNKGLAEGRVLG